MQNHKPEQIISKIFVQIRKITWSAINTILGYDFKKGNTTSVNQDGIELSESLPIAEISTNVLVPLHLPKGIRPRKIIQTAQFFREDACFCSILCTEDDVSAQISQQNPRTPAGPDGLSPRLLKEFRLLRYKPMTALINRGIKLRIFPDCIKNVIVTPFPEKFMKDNVWIGGQFNFSGLSKISRK